jgi:hypothetical protein
VGISEPKESVGFGDRLGDFEGAVVITAALGELEGTAALGGFVETMGAMEGDVEGDEDSVSEGEREGATEGVDEGANVGARDGVAEGVKS